MILSVAVTTLTTSAALEAVLWLQPAREAGVPVGEVLGDTTNGDGSTLVAVEALGTEWPRQPPRHHRKVRTDPTL